MNEMSTRQLQAEVCKQLENSKWTEARQGLDQLVLRRDVRQQLPALSTFKRSKTLPASFRKVLADCIAEVNATYQSRQEKLGFPSP